MGRKRTPAGSLAWIIILAFNIGGGAERLSKKAVHAGGLLFRAL